MKNHPVLSALCFFISAIIMSCSQSEPESYSINKVQTNESAPKSDVETEWSQWLDRYENLVERNNALQQRIKTGDLNAAQEVISISQEMVEVSQKCQENQSLMSASEVKRMMEIMKKIQY